MCSLLMWKSVGFDISMQLLFIFLPSSVLGQCCDLLMQTAISYTSAPSLFEDSRPSAPEPHDLFCSQFVFGEAAHYHKLWASIWKRSYWLSFDISASCMSFTSVPCISSFKLWIYHRHHQNAMQSNIIKVPKKYVVSS